MHKHPPKHIKQENKAIIGLLKFALTVFGECFKDYYYD